MSIDYPESKIEQVSSSYINPTAYEVSCEKADISYHPPSSTVSTQSVNKILPTESIKNNATTSIANKNHYAITNDEIDTATDYIGVADSDGTRSIIELRDEELTNGYQNMTDKEISKLIKWHMVMSEYSASVEAQDRYTEQVLSQMNDYYSQQLELSENILNELVKRSDDK